MFSLTLICDVNLAEALTFLAIFCLRYDHQMLDSIDFNA